MKKNMPTVIGIALPIVFVLVLVIIVSIRPLLITPAHDFLFTENALTNGYVPYVPAGQTIYANIFIVKNNQLTLSPTSFATSTQNTPTLYLYDIKNNASHEIDLADAQKLSLDAGPTSPDGYNISYSYGNDGIFDIFGGDSSTAGYYIGKGNAKRQLTGLGIAGAPYNDNFQFVAWVK